MRISNDGGCSFAGTASNGVIRAESASCRPLPDTAPLKVNGIEGRDTLFFSLVPSAGTFSEMGITYPTGRDPNNPDSPLKYYFNCEGNVTPSVRVDTFFFQYEGTVRWSHDAPADQSCSSLADDTTSGTLSIHFGADRNELVVDEEGMGCTVRAHSSDGVKFTADGSDCELSDTGAARLGVVARHFDSYQIDLQAKTWTYSATATRKLSSGDSVHQCMQANTQFSGSLP